MRAAAFSADGSVLAVAADTVITLWDPNNNVLVAVIGETPMVIFLNPCHPYYYFYYYYYYYYYYYAFDTKTHYKRVLSF